MGSGVHIRRAHWVCQGNVHEKAYGASKGKRFVGKNSGNKHFQQCCQRQKSAARSKAIQLSAGMKCAWEEK